MERYSALGGSQKGPRWYSRMISAILNRILKTWNLLPPFLLWSMMVIIVALLAKTTPSPAIAESLPARTWWNLQSVQTANSTATATNRPGTVSTLTSTVTAATSTLTPGTAQTPPSAPPAATATARPVTTNPAGGQGGGAQATASMTPLAIPAGATLTMTPTRRSPAAPQPESTQVAGTATTVRLEVATATSGGYLAPLPAQGYPAPVSTSPAKAYPVDTALVTAAPPEDNTLDTSQLLLPVGGGILILVLIYGFLRSRRRP